MQTTKCSSHFLNSIQAYTSKRACSSSKEILGKTNNKSQQFKKPGSCYNLTFFSISKAKKFFKHNKSIKPTYKSLSHNKKDCFSSKSPSQLSTLTPPTANMEQDTISVVNKSARKTRSNSSLIKNIFLKKAKKIKNKQKKNRYFESQCDDIVSGDFLPEELRKKMLIDIDKKIRIFDRNEQPEIKINKKKSCGDIGSNRSLLKPLKLSNSQKSISNKSNLIVFYPEKRNNVFKNKYKTLIENYLKE